MNDSTGWTVLRSVIVLWLIGTAVMCGYLAATTSDRPDAMALLSIVFTIAASALGRAYSRE